MPLYKPAARKSKSDPWYALFKDHNGTWKRKSTGYTDRKLAEGKLLEFQRRESDPDGHAQASATLDGALTLLIETRESEVLAGQISQATVDFYAKKAGVLISVLGNMPLRNLTAPVVDGYIRTRRHEVKENTISKELGTLRSALKLAKRARIWTGDMSILPIAFAPEYKPRTRFMTPPEILEYRKVMEPHKFAILAFAVATSAEWSALWRATPGDIADDYTTCRVRGSKNENRDRTIPILLLHCQMLLKVAREQADGTGFLLFKYQHNFRRDLNLATAMVYPCTCKKRQCAKCVAVRLSPNDLRRTHSKWLKLAGLSNDDVGPLLGHADGRMVAKVYGRLSPLESADRLIKQLGQGTT